MTSSADRHYGCLCSLTGVFHVGNTTPGLFVVRGAGGSVTRGELRNVEAMFFWQHL